MSPPGASATRERLLIVNADDYGLTFGTCEAIIEAHRRGIVTSTSVLAVGRAFSRGAALLQQNPSLGVGVHLALVGEDPPLCAPREIPTLVDRRGQLPPTWAALAARLALGRVRLQDLRRELVAQIERVLALGLDVTHLDSHQHVHLLPRVGELVCALARHYRVPVVRVPRSRGGRRVGLIVNALAELATHRVRAAGLRTTEDMFGFDEAGRLDRGALLRVLATIASSPTRSVELVAHPGPAQDPDRSTYAWRYRWADELEALTHADARDAVRGHGFRLASHAALAEAGP